MHQNSKTPKISFKTGANTFQYLRRDVDLRATVSIGLFIVHQLFAEAKINQLAMTTTVNQDMLRFQVSVDDLQRVDLFKAAVDLGHVELVVHL